MFKERLAQQLKASGLTQTELAKRVGVSQGTIGFWLRGSEPRRPQYEALLSVFPSLRDEPEQVAS